MIRVKKIDEIAELAKLISVPIKNMVIIEISVGKRPLQGTKLLVIMAISLSLGESIMRQPMIPAALQPKPMHMVYTIL